MTSDVFLRRIRELKGSKINPITFHVGDLDAMLTQDRIKLPMILLTADSIVIYTNLSKHKSMFNEIPLSEVINLRIEKYIRYYKCGIVIGILFSPLFWFYTNLI